MSKAQETGPDTLGASPDELFSLTRKDRVESTPVVRHYFDTLRSSGGLLVMTLAFLGENFPFDEWGGSSWLFLSGFLSATLISFGWIELHPDRLVFVRACGLYRKQVHVGMIERIARRDPKPRAPRPFFFGGSEEGDEDIGMIKLSVFGESRPIRIGGLTPNKARDFVRRLAALCPHLT